MEFGIFHEFWSTDAPSQAAAFANSFAQIAAAEEWAKAAACDGASVDQNS